MDARRRILLGASLWGGALALAGCGSQDPTDGSDESTDGDAVNVRPSSGLTDPNHCVLSADGSHVMALVRGGVGVWSTADGGRARTLSVDATEGLAAQPKGSLVAVGGTKARIHLIDAEKGDIVRTLTGHDASDGVRTVRFSPDGAHLASVGEDGTVRIWRTKDGRSATVQFTGSRPASLAFDAKGDALAIGSLDVEVEVADPKTGKTTRTVDAGSGQGVSVDFSRDGRWLVIALAATPKPGRVVLVDARAWRRERDLLTDLSPRSVAASPDSGTVAVCDRRTKGVLLAPLSGDGPPRTLQTPQDTPRSVVWSPDGSRLYALGESLVELDVDSGEVTREFSLT